jgi:hypothetical protein
VAVAVLVSVDGTLMDTLAEQAAVAEDLMVLVVGKVEDIPITME